MAAGWHADAAKAHTAQAGIGTIIDYTTSFTSPSTTSIPVHHLKPGDQVQTYCGREGQVLNGNAYWFAIHTDGETAYIHRASISPPDGMRHC